jgi:uncharacterized protein YyaL (SSP411 family)
MTGKTEFETKAMQTLQAFADSASQTPAAHTHYLMALDFAIGPSHEVVVVGDLRKDYARDMLNALKGKFIPNKVVLFRPSQAEPPEIVQYAEFMRNLASKDG